MEEEYRRRGSGTFLTALSDGSNAHHESSASENANPAQAILTDLVMYSKHYEPDSERHAEDEDAEGEGQEATGEVGLDELMQGYSNVLLTDDQLGMIRRKKQPKVEQPRAVAPPSVAMKPTIASVVRGLQTKRPVPRREGDWDANGRFTSPRVPGPYRPPQDVDFRAPIPIAQPPRARLPKAQIRLIKLTATAVGVGPGAATGTVGGRREGRHGEHSVNDGSASHVGTRGDSSSPSRSATGGNTGGVVELSITYNPQPSRPTSSQTAVTATSPSSSSNGDTSSSQSSAVSSKPSAWGAPNADLVALTDAVRSGLSLSSLAAAAGMGRRSSVSRGSMSGAVGGGTGSHSLNSTGSSYIGGSGTYRRSSISRLPTNGSGNDHQSSSNGLPPLQGQLPPLAPPLHGSSGANQRRDTASRNNQASQTTSSTVSTSTSMSSSSSRPLLKNPYPQTKPRKPKTLPKIEDPLQKRNKFLDRLMSRPVGAPTPSMLNSYQKELWGCKRFIVQQEAGGDASQEQQQQQQQQQQQLNDQQADGVESGGSHGTAGEGSQAQERTVSASAELRLGSSTQGSNISAGS